MRDDKTGSFVGLVEKDAIVQGRTKLEERDNGTVHHRTMCSLFPAQSVSKSLETVEIDSNMYVPSIKIFY